MTVIRDYLDREVQRLYVQHKKDAVDGEDITRKIAEILTPEGTQATVEIVFQSIEGLHKACPNHQGDWYFTGDYPTPGGNMVVNNAFIRYFENMEKGDL